MRLPIEFYTLESQELINFTKQPPGHLNVRRLINGLPAWQKLLPGFALKPKTLLINIFAKRLQETTIIEKLHELMDLGFPIYYRQDSQFLLLTKEIPASSLWSAKPSFITEAANDLPQHLLDLKNNNKLLIIQDCEMQALLDNDFSEQDLRIATSDFFMEYYNQLSRLMVFGFRYHFNRLSAQLPQNFFNELPVNIKLTLDIFTAPSLEITGFNKPVTFDPDSKIRRAYLNDETINSLIHGLADTSSSSNNKLTPALSIHHFNSLESLIYCPQTCPIEGDYQSINEYHEAKQLYDHYLNKYEYGLQLDSFAPYLELFLSHTPNLKELKLEYLKSRAQWPLMPELTHLTIGFVYDTMSLQNLLKQCPNLESIEFSFGISFDLTGMTNWPIMPKLKQFISHSSSDKIILTQAFLTSLPALESLNLAGNLKEIPPLASLKSLTITSSDADIPTILEQCPSLINLDLGITQPNSFESLQTAIHNAQHLKSIRLRSISTKEIHIWEKLLESCPAVRSELIIQMILSNYLNRIKIPDINYFISILAYSESEINLDFKKIARRKGLHFLEELDRRATNINKADLQSNIELLKHAQQMRPVAPIPISSSDNSPQQELIHWDLLFKELKKIWSHDVHFELDINWKDLKGLLNAQSTNQAFNPQSMQSHNPKSSHELPHQDQSEVFSQAMLINQLSHYLTLTNAQIPPMQQEIPQALCHLCNSMTPAEWFGFLQLISEWDRNKDTLKPIHYKVFDNLLTYINKYQFNLDLHMPYQTWAGANVIAWLPTQDMPVILSNAWHTVALRRLDKEGFDYFAYNPNVMGGGIGLTHEQLPDFLKASLGDLNQILIEGLHQIDLQSPEPSSFILNGGLLTLLKAENKNRVLNLLIEQDTLLPHDALEGLFVRNLTGSPAWFIALYSENNLLIQYTLSLLAQYVEAHPSTYWIKLKNSAELIEAFSLEGIIERLHHLHDQNLLFPAHQALVTELSDLLIALNAIENDREAFRVIGTNHPSSIDAESYLAQILQSDSKSHLIEMPDSSSIQTLRFELQALAEQTGFPLLYIDTPEGLSCSNPFVELQADGKTGLFKQGPGGTLHKSLTQGAPLILLINFDRFPKSAMVRFNALIDKEPKADGTPLPPGTKVIALLNPNNPECYRGRDLYSRFETKEIYPLAVDTIKQPRLEIRSDLGPEDYIIELFNAQDWHERLLGYWAVRGDHLELIPGELQKALLSERPISLANAPWEIKEFLEFWQEATVRGYLIHEEQRINLPNDFQFGELQDYNWAEKAQCISHCDYQIDSQGLILNTYSLTDFLMQYQCINKTESILVDSGWIEKYAHQQLSVNVSHNLTKDVWARFLHHCNEHKVKLQLHLAAEIKLPIELLKCINLTSTPQSITLPAHANTLIILSDAPDTTRAQFGPGYLSIDISECDPCDLLNSIDGYFDTDPNELRLRFQTTEGLLPKSFETYDRIILRGQFSNHLIQALLPLLQTRFSHGANNILILLPDNIQALDFSYLPIETRHVSIAEKKVFLPSSTFPDELFAREDLATLRARQRYYQPASASSSTNTSTCQTGDEAWLGINHLPARIAISTFDAENSQAITEAFTQERMNRVLHRLDQSPFVLITGLTGVGKSTFVEKELAAFNGFYLHYGDQAIENWYNDNRPGKKILFLDEANQKNRSLSEFEGLFETPPQIRIKNKIKILSNEHLMIGAINPASYGDKRMAIPLFERHGNAVLFDPMPLEYIYEKILKPIFKNSSMESLAPDIALEFLRIYEFLCQCSVTRVLISPRELEMMALLTLVHEGADNPINTARYYARSIAQDLVPKAFMNSFNKKFPALSLQPKPLAFNDSNSVDPRSFFYTPSREPIASLLHDLLNLREIRYKQPDAGEHLLYGGLGGIILEGDPGVGKTEMVLDILKRRGYLKGHPGKAFYHIPASMNQEAKKQLILQAFHQGAVVLIDEINSIDWLEDFLNDLLMGKSPDKERPINPGFLILGTQNPAAMGGRLVASNALERRTINIKLPNYTQPEMVSILRNMGLTRARTYSLINLFIEECNNNQHLTFRDLTRRARTILNCMEESINLYFPTINLGHQSCMVPSASVIDADSDPCQYLKNLIDKIDNLRAYGRYLSQSDDPRRQLNGEKTIRCAQKLLKQIREPTTLTASLNKAYQSHSTHYNKASFFLCQKTTRQKLIMDIKELVPQRETNKGIHLAKFTLPPVMALVAGVITTALMISFPLGLPGILVFATIVAGIALLSAAVGFGLGVLIDNENTSQFNRV